MKAEKGGELTDQNKNANKYGHHMGPPPFGGGHGMGMFKY